MASKRPAWVVKDLADILGFDEGTVSEAILPELESQTHQTRLQSHLQDFLGPSPRARSFIEKYISFRFPSIPTPTLAALPSLKASSQTGYQRSQPPPRPSSGSRSPYPDPSAFPPPQTSSSPNLGQAVSDAFSSGSARVQSKNAFADSGRSSGYNTPQFRQPTRQGGSLVIHEAKPKNKSKAGGSGSGSGAGGRADPGKGDRIWDIPKSKEVKRLETLVERLGAVRDGKKVKRGDEIPDCFCQARVHRLSPYTPHCPHCGLILCNLQPPELPCPSCLQPLYTPAQLARLIMRVTTEIEEQLDSEQAERDAIEKQRQDRLIAESGGGAFPTLPPGGTGHGGKGMSMADASRKVLTIGGSGKGKGKAVLTTTTYRQVPTPTATEPSTPAVYNTIARPRSPPLERAKIEKELEKWTKWREAEDRPWGDMKADKDGESWVYVELPISHWVEEGTEGRRKAAKKKKKEGGQGENGRVVPGAA